MNWATAVVYYLALALVIYCALGATALNNRAFMLVCAIITIAVSYLVVLGIKSFGDHVHPQPVRVVPHVIVIPFRSDPDIQLAEPRPVYSL